MSQEVPIETMTLEETIVLLQQRLTMFTGYAFALAQKAGLTPEEAAQMFMESHRTSNATLSSSAEMLEQQAQSNAISMAVSNGRSNVRLERDANRWLIKILLTQDRPIIEQWGASLAFLARWLQEQARLIGEPKGIAYKCWLDGEVLHVALVLRSESPKT